MPKSFRTLATAASALALAVSFQATAALAHDEVAPVAQDAPATPDATPAMWKVTDEDTTIYLFGTVHTLPADARWNHGVVKSAIDSADTLVTEIDMNPESMASMGPLIASKGMLSEGQTLRGLMNEEQRTAYEAGLAKLGVPVGAFDPVEPWLAAIGLTQVLVQKAGYSGESGAETVLEATVAPDVTRESLETVEYQIAVFDELPVADQLTFLLEGLENPDEALAMLETLVAEWRQGDVEGMDVLLKQSAAASPELAERLFYVRNANWAGWIDDRMKVPGTVFLAVGAGHLAGDKSVQDYLRERGIESARVQ